jgi:double-stranded uracil-DNA glycosylase
MDVIRSFKPVSDRTARTLVLGSMPGVRSLQASRYYAHPRNAFWPIMANILDISEESPYETRLQSLLTARIALWDVLHACVRNGSLDSAIATGSRVPNDFAAFFARHPDIRLVCFNGTEAERSFRAYALPTLNVSGIKYVRLPSTSPAHAVSFDQKLKIWRAALRG